MLCQVEQHLGTDYLANRANNSDELHGTVLAFRSFTMTFSLPIRCLAALSLIVVGCSQIEPLDNCPEYSAPLCENGTFLGSGYDANGCSMPVCENCPAYSAPQCENGMILGWGYDANGCSMPMCK